VQLWNKETVLCAEQTQNFKLSAESKRETELARSDDKTKKLVRALEACPISVNYLSKDSLIDGMLHSQLVWDWECRSYPLPESLVGIPTHLIEYRLVNYIRHRLTHYDRYCELLIGHIGQAKGYAVLKNKVLDKIAEVYPYLAAECARQKIT
jgi:hypothetical protein